MNTHNVNTAASESTETWVKQNFDVHLAARTNRRFSLAKLEGDLMKRRAMEKLGVETEDLFEDLFDDLQMAASCISTMIYKGDNTSTPAWAGPICGRLSTECPIAFSSSGRSASNSLRSRRPAR